MNIVLFAQVLRYISLKNVCFHPQYNGGEFNLFPETCLYILQKTIKIKIKFCEYHKVNPNHLLWRRLSQNLSR